MMKRGILLVLCLGAAVSGSAHADLRVLFTFDNAGVKAHQVVEVAATRENYPTSVAELPASPGENMIMMQWVDAEGQLLAVTQSPDPRVIRAPEHVNPSAVASVGLAEGAWVGDGPDGSAMVTIEFPANVTLGLSLETWSLPLRQDN